MIQKQKLLRNFFKTIQNKMHWAIHGHTAAEVIVERLIVKKNFMGLTTFEGKYPNFYETTIAKNYLTKEELKSLERTVTMYLDDNLEKKIETYMKQNEVNKKRCYKRLC